MRALRNKFRNEVIRKQKCAYFASVRNEMIEIEAFKNQYESVLEKDMNLCTLIEHQGCSVFYKHYRSVVDDRIYQKLYQNVEYFIENLNFFTVLLEHNYIPSQKIEQLFMALNTVLDSSQTKFDCKMMDSIFDVITKILDSSSEYHEQALESFKLHSILKKLHEVVLLSDQLQYLSPLIQICRKFKLQDLSISSDQLINCLQINILITKDSESLNLSYRFLAELFQLKYDCSEELFEYGSIIDKAFQDLQNYGVFDSVTYFLHKVISNRSIIKLMLGMRAEVRFVEFLMQCDFNNSQINAYHSLWRILNELMKEKISIFSPSDRVLFQNFVAKVKQSDIRRYPYLRQEFELFLSTITRSNSFLMSEN